MAFLLKGSWRRKNKNSLTAGMNLIALFHLLLYRADSGKAF